MKQKIKIKKFKNNEKIKISKYEKYKIKNYEKNEN